MVEKEDKRKAELGGGTGGEDYRARLGVGQFTYNAV